MVSFDRPYTKETLEKEIVNISPISKFVITAIFIFAGWTLFYDLYILPDGDFETFLSLSSVSLAASILKVVGIEVESNGRLISCLGSKAVQVNNGCNGLQLIGLYSGFIIAYPGNWIPRMFLLITGISLLLFANVVRISFFAIFNSNFPEHWDIAHDASSYIFFYPIVLSLWYVWTIISGENSLLKKQLN